MEARLLLSFLLFAAVFLVLLFFTINKYASATANTTTTATVNTPPGSSGWPIFGEIFELSSDPAKFVKKRITKYKTLIFRTNLLTQPMAVVLGPAAHKLLFSNESKLVSIWWPSSIQTIFANSVINTSGRRASHTRRLLSAYLSPSALLHYVPRMDGAARRHIEAHWVGNLDVKAFPLLKLYTFYMACSIFTGVDDPVQVSALLAQFKTLLRGLLGVPLKLPGTRFYQSLKAAEAIRKHFGRLIDQKKESLLEKKSSATLTATPDTVDLLTYLLVTEDEEGRLMTEREILDNILLLLFAGHDTATSTMAMLLKYLADMPHIYDGVFKEQMEIAMSKGPEELLDWKDIQNMKYSWNVVNEVMRLSPPVQGAFREAIADFSFEGYDIPKGWKLYWTVHSTHKNPEYFPEPEKFDPSRFEGEGPAPYTFIPFGGGPRMCPGKEFAKLQILVLLHNLVKRFRWEQLSPNEKIVIDPMPIPVEGLPLKLHPHHF